MKKLGIRRGTTEAIFTNRIQEVEDRILGIEDMIEEMDQRQWVKDNVKSESLLRQNIEKI